MKPTKRMTGPLAVLLSLVLILALGGCQKETPAAPAAPQAVPQADPAVVGRYVCTESKLDNMDMGTEGKWIELNPDWTAALFLVSTEDEVNWKLQKEAFTLSIGEETIGTGTLSQGVLTLDLVGTQCTFVKETAAPPAEPAPEAAPAQENPAEQTPPPAQPVSKTLSCYDGLYQVTYPTTFFTPSPGGNADFYTPDGTVCWLSRLDSEDYVQASLADFDQKAAEPDLWNYQGGSLPTASGYTGRWMVYADEEFWHSEVIIPFQEDKGREGLPMYAAYLYFSGNSPQGVWNETISAMAASFQLGQ